MHIARTGETGPVRASDAARSLRLPENYLSKILHTLVRSGVVTSERGRGGGFTLARPADRIKLAEIVEPFDDLGARRQCLLGRPSCSNRSPCPAHAQWAEVNDRVQDFFQNTTAADLYADSSSETRTHVTAARSR